MHVGAIGHVRIDFGLDGKEFWHTWHPRGNESLNSAAFKKELGQVVDQFRDSVLKDLNSMSRFCCDHGGAIEGGSEVMVIGLKLISTIWDDAAVYENLWRLGMGQRKIKALITKQMVFVYFIPTALGCLIGAFTTYRIMLVTGVIYIGETMKLVEYGLAIWHPQDQCAPDADDRIHGGTDPVPYTGDHAAGRYFYGQNAVSKNMLVADRRKL